MESILSPAVLKQIAFQFILLVQGEEFKQWHKTCGSPMTQLHWTVYAYFESMFVCLGEFATHFINVSIYRIKGPITDLGTKLLIKIITARNHMIHHFEGLFSLGAPEDAIPRLMPSHAKKRNTAQVVALETYAPKDQVAEVPANDQDTEKAFKKKKKNETRKIVHHDQPDDPPTTNTSHGMFFLTDPSAPLGNIFQGGS